MSLLTANPASSWSRAAAAAGRLIVEIDRQAWPHAGQVYVGGPGPLWLRVEPWTVEPGQSRHTFENLPAGTARVSLATAL